MRGILAFWLPHYPLALTSVITMSTAPLLTFSLGRGRDPLQCLAIWQLVYAFVFFFRSGGGAFQEVGVAFTGADASHAPQVRRAAIVLAACATGLMLAVVLSPLARLWFRDGVGLGAELLPFALLPTKVLVLFPAMDYLLSFQRSRWILARRTQVVSAASALETAGIALRGFPPRGPTSPQAPPAHLRSRNHRANTPSRGRPCPGRRSGPRMPSTNHGLPRLQDRLRPAPGPGQGFQLPHRLGKGRQRSHGRAQGLRPGPKRRVHEHPADGRAHGGHLQRSLQPDADALGDGLHGVGDLVPAAHGRQHQGQAVP